MDHPDMLGRQLAPLSFSWVSTASRQLQWLPVESLQVQFYEAKLPFLERSIAIQKYHHPIELLRHSHHTLALQKEVYNFFLLRVLKSYQPSEFESVNFLSKICFTFLLWLLTFQPLEQKQSYIPLLKVLMCGMSTQGAQQYGGIFILQ